MQKTILSLLFTTLCGLAISQNSNETKVLPKPKRIIFLIGDGMGLSQISAGMVYRGGDLNLARFKRVGFIKTQSADDFITDSAAGATAFSIGKKTRNYAIGVDSLYNTQKTILESAVDAGYSTGMVASCALTHATPASFIAHQKNRNMQNEIAYDFTKTKLNVAIGGGQKFFSNKYRDMNLLDTLKKKGYDIFDSTQNISNISSKRFYAFTNQYHTASMQEGRGAYLQTASLKAIEVLSKNNKGFFLMIEGSQIDWGGHDNNVDYIATEMVDFDITIGKVLDWAEKDGETLVVVTADHETGGLALTGGSFQNRTVEGKFVSKDHTGTLIPVFAFGPGADEFTGIYDNTEIYTKMMQFLHLD